MMSASGQKRKSEAIPGMSAPGGEADVIRLKADIDLDSVNHRPLIRLSLQRSNDWSNVSNDVKRFLPKAQSRPLGAKCRIH